MNGKWLLEQYVCVCVCVCVCSDNFIPCCLCGFCACVVYEYVADSEEATLSQCESVRSLCSVDDAEFRSKTHQFFEGMARLRQEVEAEHKVEQQKTHTVSRSFYPRRVSDNVTHRTNVMINVASPSEPKLERTGAELYTTFSNKLLMPDLTAVDRRRSASSASDRQFSHELGQFLRPGDLRPERSQSVTSTPSTLQRPLSRQSESEESISMIDVTWQHRKPAARKRQRRRPKMWEETEAETLSVVLTSKLKQEKRMVIGKQHETIQLRERESQREKSRRDEIAKQLEMVEQQERKIKEELAKQQKMLQQFAVVRQKEMERERVEDFVRQQELLKEQEIIRKQELTRLSELQKQHELAKKLAFQKIQTEVKDALEAEKVEQKVETQDETNLITVGISSLVKPSVESPVISVEAPEDSNNVELQKLKMVGERLIETPSFSAVESLHAAKIRQVRFCVTSAFVDELPNILSFLNPLCMKAAANCEKLESPASVKRVNVRTVLPTSETPSVPVLEDGAMVSVAKEVIHTEHVTEILTPQDLQVVELVEKSFSAKPVKTSQTFAVRHYQSSEDDVFFDASDVDAHSASADAAEAGEIIPTGSLLMAPVFELPLADVIAFDGAGAILECRVTGNPTPEVMWFVNGVEIRSMPPEVTVSYHAGVCRMVIVDVMPDDEGEYTVRAINEAGSCLTSAYLTVLRKFTCLFLF